MAPSQTATNQIPEYSDEHLSIDFKRGVIKVDSTPATFTRKQYELLRMLVEHAGQVIPRETLLMNVWGYSNQIRTRTLDVHLSHLRKKLAPYGDQYIERVFRVGCRFQPRVTRTAMQ
jgi:two-component system, OmpR family, alkaline phosphatase synthesis response regulator PhoP